MFFSFLTIFYTFCTIFIVITYYLAVYKYQNQISQITTITEITKIPYKKVTFYRDITKYFFLNVIFSTSFP